MKMMMVFIVDMALMQPLEDRRLACSA